MIVDVIEKRLKTFFTEQSQGNFNTQVGLKRGDIPGIEEPFQVSRGRVWRIQLCKRRRQQKYSSAQIG